MAFVALGDNTQSVAQIDLATNTLVRTIGVGYSPQAVAITPDGTTAYAADYGSHALTPIDVATGAAKADIDLGSGHYAHGIAISPDGATAYVTTDSSGSGGSLPGVVIPVTLATQVVGTPITTGSAQGVAVSPDGSKVYVSNTYADTVTPVDVASGVAGTPIAVPGDVHGLAFSPSGATLYAGISFNASPSTEAGIVPITVLTNFAAPPIVMHGGVDGVAVSPDGTNALAASVGGVTPVAFGPGGGATAGAQLDCSQCGPQGVAYTPGGATAFYTEYTTNWDCSSGSCNYVSQTGSLRSINVAARTQGTPIPLGQHPRGLAIVPDQAPVAAFSVTPGAPGTATTFDASTSTDADGTIASYQWVFGDGQTATTSTPTTSHTYGSVGSYPATVTVADNEGCSTQLVYTGQTATCNGKPSATAAHAVRVGLDDVNITISGSGSVADYSGQIHCPTASCVGSFNAGDPITLIASAAAGSAFTGWTGACAGQGGACRIYASQSFYDITASFAPSGTQTPTQTQTQSQPPPYYTGPLPVYAPPRAGSTPPPTTTAAPARCVVPRLRGLKLPGARSKLKRAHCTLGRVRKASGRHGRVLRTKQRTGARLAHNAKVGVTIGR